MCRKPAYLATLAILLTTVLPGCRQEPLPASGDAISFSVAPAEISVLSTKAIADDDKPTAETSLICDGSKVMLYGHHTSSTPVFTDMVLTCTESSGAFSWGYTPPIKYWVRKAAYDFFAVFPYNASISGNSITGLTVDYKMQKAVSNNMQRSDCDLMVASASVTSAPPPTDGTGKVKPVTLKFNHVCAAVRFVFKDADTPISNYHITSFELQGLYTDNTYNVSTGAWNALTAPATRVSPVWSWSGDCLVKAAYDYLWTPDPTDPTVPSVWYFAIPQGLDANNSKIKFTYTVGNETDAQKIPVTLNLATGGITEWAIGKVYTYKIQIRANAIEFTVSFDTWKETSDTALIEP